MLDNVYDVKVDGVFSVVLGKGVMMMVIIIIVVVIAMGRVKGGAGIGNGDDGGDNGDSDVIVGRCGRDEGNVGGGDDGVYGYKNSEGDGNSDDYDKD